MVGILYLPDYLAAVWWSGTGRPTPHDSPGQFEHGMRLMEEVGRLLGGWQRIHKAQAAARAAPPAPGAADTVP